MAETPMMRQYNAAKKKAADALLFFRMGESHELSRFYRRSIAVGLAGVRAVRKELGMLRAPRRQHPSGSLKSKRIKWIRASRSGIAHLRVSLKDFVKRNRVVAEMRDVFGDGVAELRSPLTDLGMGLTTNPLAYRGNAVMRVALHHSSS